MIKKFLLHNPDFLQQAISGDRRDPVRILFQAAVLFRSQFEETTIFSSDYLLLQIVAD